MGRTGPAGRLPAGGLAPLPTLLLKAVFSIRFFFSFPLWKFCRSHLVFSSLFFPWFQLPGLWLVNALCLQSSAKAQV